MCARARTLAAGYRGVDRSAGYSFGPDTDRLTPRIERLVYPPSPSCSRTPRLFLCRAVNRIVASREDDNPSQVARTIGVGAYHRQEEQREKERERARGRKVVCKVKGIHLTP